MKTILQHLFPRRRRGASAIEFALTAPVVVLLTMGTFDFCWYFAQWQQVLAAAQVGARAGSQTKLSEFPDVIGAHAADDALTAHYFGAVPDGTSVTGTVIDAYMVRIDIVVPFKPLVGFVPTPERITVTSQMLIEDLR